ncbi:hypothetical protein C8R44DRAFT_731295 [Mycena epipterygia]|nr:hypothetical protein C8R44DRAFT_731295 [Mycena epipterygia]
MPRQCAPAASFSPDRYTRYWAWFHPTLPSSSGPTIEKFKAGTTLTRLLEDYYSELADSDSDSKPSSSKKVKLEKSTVTRALDAVNGVGVGGRDTFAVDAVIV